MPRMRLALPALSTRRLLALAVALALAPTLTVVLAGIGPLALAVALAQGALLLVLLWRRQSVAAVTAPVGRGPAGRAAIDAMLAQVPRSDRPESLQTAALVLRLDRAGQLQAGHADAVMTALSVRLGGALREGDGFCLLDTNGFAVALTPQRRLSVESVLAVAGRLQSALSRPLTLDGETLWPSVSVGFCLSQRAAQLNGLSMLDAAAQAAEAALARGPNGLESFSVVEMPAQAGGFSLTELRGALDRREIRAHFQPQVSCATGAVTGLEALARWHHPVRGLIAPGAFLPAIDALDLAPRLTARILEDALELLNRLDAADLSVPTVAINLSEQDLRGHDLADRIAWALDAQDLAPQRLVLEILETVVAGQGDTQMAATVARLAAMGCAIDLDDFGTGSASITGIRRFAANRLKIDRSFVGSMCNDPDQRRVVAAIVSMATELGLDTLAEGVEDAQTLQLLTDMGCGHAQGFHIARPMPAEALGDWLSAQAPRLLRDSRR